MLKTIKGGELGIFVHYNHQLVRNIRYVDKITHFEGISYNNSNNLRTIELNSICIMRSRTNANEPCNQELDNDDEEWMHRVVTLVGCFPPYWKKMYSRGNNFNECNMTEQLKNMSNYLPYANKYMTNSVLKMYQPPCENMRVLAITKNFRHIPKQLLNIRLRFR